MIGVHFQPHSLLTLGQGQGGGQATQGFGQHDRGAPMQYAVGLHMAPIHGHFSPDEIRPYLQDTDPKGTGQAIGHAGFDGRWRCGSFPNAHAFTSCAETGWEGSLQLSPGKERHVPFQKADPNPASEIAAKFSFILNFFCLALYR
jgi:hypothetical protein